MLIFDAHLDLSMNAMEWNRDYTQPIAEIRKREAHLIDKPDRGKGVISFEEMRKGGVHICVATLIARYVKPSSALPGWNSPFQAWAQTQAQLAWYNTMEKIGELTQIYDYDSLEMHLNNLKAESTNKKPIGYILSLEGADSFYSLDCVDTMFEAGLRAIGPAHYGPGTYSFGTDSDGPLSSKGKELLKKMSDYNFILDLTHLSDQCFWEALDLYGGAVWASHHLCRSITPHNRQLSDEQIKAIINRNGVIGMAFDNWMIVPNWKRGESTPIDLKVNIAKVIDHLDHICQIAGNTNHVGIGSDLDGAFGKEQSPYDLETIADLAKLENILEKRGYSEDDINNILHRNWINFLKNHWE
jgi:membrane dipeptidase